MTKLRFVLSSMAMVILSSCRLEEDVTICHFPDESDDFEIIDVAASELEDHIFDHGDLCFGGDDDTCYEPDFDGWEIGGELCPS